MILWGGVGCCLSAAALYLLGRKIGKDADVLKSVTRINNLRDISALLDVAYKVLPLVVTISGRVGSEMPIKCERSGLRGVIVEETAEQHFLRHNDAGLWKQHSPSKVSMKEVPWYLDDGTGHVYVVGARSAIGLALIVASEIFDDSGRLVVRGPLDRLQDLKLLGVRRIERVLPIGTPMTVVGEVVKDGLGTIRIQQPQRGPFYVSPKSIDQLIVNLVKLARWYKVASMGFIVFAVYLLAKHVIQNILVRRCRRFLQSRVLDAAAKRKEHERPNKNSEKGPDNIDRDSMPDICAICLENNYNVIFVKCGHMCCCLPCASHLRICPLCRRKIDQVVMP